MKIKNRKLQDIISFVMIKYIWRPPRKSGLNPKTTKARVIHYAIIQSPQWFWELTHSSSEVSLYAYSMHKVERIMHFKIVKIEKNWYLFLGKILWLDLVINYICFIPNVQKYFHKYINFFKIVLWNSSKKSKFSS